MFSGKNVASNVLRYANGHLFNLYTDRTSLEEQVAVKLGGLSPKDFDEVDKFGARIKKISDYALERDCQLYVDAEQTYIQAAIESFG